jgi:ABC-type transport system substrate-binding protein
MKKTLLSFIGGTLLLLFSCGDSSKKPNNDSQNDGIGGCMDFAIAEKVQTLDPIKVADISSFWVASQVYEPLLRFDEKKLSLEPLLAESWEVGENNLIHTFFLKKGAHFHDNACFAGGKGREIKASDVIYSFKRIYTVEERNYAYSYFKDLIVGGEDFKKSGGEISGIKAIDDYTIEITLTKPSSNFMNFLGTVLTSIVPKEGIEKNEIVGSGPFTYNKANDTEKAVTLLKNKNYHVSTKKGNSLPYLDSVVYHYIQPGQGELDLFMDNKLDVITGIPSESIKEIVEDQIADFQDKPAKYVLGRYPQLTTTYLSFNLTTPPFNNIKVRQAIGMAINKTKIVDDILKGEAYGPGDHGIVPSAIKNYDFSSIVGLEYNVVKAKQLLAEAGYPDGKGLPALLFSTKKENVSLRVALNIQKQLLTNLNLNVEISSLTLAEKMEKNSNLQNNLSLDTWSGEFPDPISFLTLFYGKNMPSDIDQPSFPNVSRYNNAEFDKLYEKASVTIDPQKRYELCLSADQLIASEVPSVPLWYHEHYQLIQSSVKDYQPNAMKIQYLTYVKLIDIPNEKK